MSKPQAQPQFKPPEPNREIPSPVNVVDGIPDRAAKGPKWKYWALAVVFLLWVAFLIYCTFAGGPER